MASLFGAPVPLIVFDVANIAYRAAHRFPNFTTRKGYPSGHIFGSFKIIVSNIKKIGGDSESRLVFALDGEPARRLRLEPTYKKGRPKTEYNPVVDVNEMVRLFPGETVSHRNLEADDIMAVLTHKKYRGKKPIVLVTKDQDMWQLLGLGGIRIWDKDHFVSKTEVIAKYGVHDPKAVALHKTLFGCKTDRIKGAVPGMRQNPVVDLINSSKIFRPSELLNLLESNHPTLKQASKDKILDAWDKIELNWKMTKLRRKTRLELKREKGPRNHEPLLKLLKRYECRSLYDTAKEMWER